MSEQNKQEQANIKNANETNSNSRLSQGVRFI